MANLFDVIDTAKTNHFDSLESAVIDFEKKYITEIIMESGSLKKASERLKIDLSTLVRKRNYQNINLFSDGDIKNKHVGKEFDSNITIEKRDYI